MRLLIVDDGHYIVEYLKHLLDWSKFGIKQIETTTNSIEAKELLSQNHMDILITDIRMPEVSGIDLLQHIHEKKLKTKVVFLSGYSQFDYAQQAIRMGALDYLLKPVDKEDMEKAMNQVIKSIDEKQSTSSVEGEKLDGLGYLLSVIGEHQPARNNYSTYDTAVRNDQFCFFHISNATEKDEMTLRDHCSGLGNFIWRTHSGMVGAILKSSSVILASSTQPIVFSEVFEFSQRNAVRHMFYQFFFDENIGGSDFAMLREHALPNLEPGGWEHARKDILKTFAKLTSQKHKRLYVLELIHLLYSTTQKIQSTEASDWIFNQLSNPDAALQSIIQSVTQLDRSAKFSNHNIVYTIQTYISDHISDCLSLEDLGKVVHLHPVYLSKFYKQETGENLSSYISFKRLEKASKLLIDSKLNVLDISHLVGYKKPQYFIKLFKDQYGLTPYQYRRQQI